MNGTKAVGHIETSLNKMLKSKKISIYKLSKLTGIKYDIIRNYCLGTCTRYDLYSLARICSALECNVSDILTYIAYEEENEKND